MNLFGKKKVAKAPSINDSIKVLREQINIQDKREEHLQKQVDSCTATIREKMKVKDKRGRLCVASERAITDALFALFCLLCVLRCSPLTVLCLLVSCTAAMAYLKKKKMFEKEIDQIFNKRNNLEAQVRGGLNCAISTCDVLYVQRRSLSHFLFLFFSSRTMILPVSFFFYT